MFGTTKYMSEIGFFFNFRFVVEAQLLNVAVHVDVKVGGK